MGYLDSCHLVFKYLKATKFDQRMKTSLNIQASSEHRADAYMSLKMNINFNRNKASTEHYYDAQTATIQNQLNQLQADPNADQNTVNQLNQQIKDVKKQKELALARLQAQFDTDNNKMVLSKNKRDEYYDLKQHYWDEQEKLDTNLLNQAKKDRDAGLNALYPKQPTTTTT